MLYVTRSIEQAKVSEDYINNLAKAINESTNLNNLRMGDLLSNRRGVVKYILENNIGYSDPPHIARSIQELGIYKKKGLWIG